MTETLIEIYRIVLQQYGIAGAYTIKYSPPTYPNRGGEGVVSVFDDWGNILTTGAPSIVLHQARQW